MATREALNAHRLGVREILSTRSKWANQTRESLWSYWTIAIGKSRRSNPAWDPAWDTSAQDVIDTAMNKRKNMSGDDEEAIKRQEANKRQETVEDYINFTKGYFHNNHVSVSPEEKKRWYATFGQPRRVPGPMGKNDWKIGDQPFKTFESFNQATEGLDEFFPTPDAQVPNTDGTNEHPIIKGDNPNPKHRVQW